jgi:hypothetical protein
MLKLSVRRILGIALAAVLAVTCLALNSSSTVSASTPPVGALLMPRPDGDHDDDKDDDRDPEILRFSTVGDSRQDPVTFDPTTAPLSGQDKIWLQSTKAFTRILDTIHEQKASMLFFNGDMIMGYGKASVPADTSTVEKIVGSDLVKFYTQYAFWRGMVSRTMENGTYVVPVPGNHEVQQKSPVKSAKIENENAWRANMADLILDDARFTTLFGQAPANELTGDNRAAADGLTTDQSKLSYSFDFNGMHFAVINTDPVGKDSHAPTTWLAGDLAAAKDRGTKRSFVFGHKPAFTYYYGAGASAPLPTSAAGRDIDRAARDAFWAVIEQYEATYFCGHEHIFNIMQPTKTTGGRSYQVMVGSGGSPFEAKLADTTLNPLTDRDYAWATLKVYQSGKVKLTAYGFSDFFGPTHVIQKVTIP